MDLEIVKRNGAQKKESKLFPRLSNYKLFIEIEKPGEGAHLWEKLIKQILDILCSRLYEMSFKHTENGIREPSVDGQSLSLWTIYMHVGMGSNVWLFILALRVEAVKACLSVVGIEQMKKKDFSVELKMNNFVAEQPWGYL